MIKSNKKFVRFDGIDDGENMKDNLALEIVFVEMSDCVVMDVLRFDWEILGKINGQSNLESCILDALGKCSTEVMHKDFQYRAEFDQFAENGAFWGGEKPVPRFERFDEKEGWHKVIIAGNEWEINPMLSRVMVELGVEIHKPRKFSSHWEDLTKGLVRYSSSMGELTADSPVYPNKLPFRASVFKMYAEAEDGN